MILAETSQRCMKMTSENRELNTDELGSITGGGIVDTVASEAEATTNAFLKRFAESAQRFSAFINAPSANQGAAASN